MALEARTLESWGFEVRHTQSASPDLDGVRLLVVNSGVAVDAALLTGADELGLVITTTSGFDHIDTQAAREQGIAVARCPVSRRDAVVDTTLGMGLSLLRDLPGMQRAARRGQWVRSELPKRGARRIRDCRVGIVGLGVIGQRAAERWSALGAEVLYTDPRHADSASLEVVLGCDIVSLHCSAEPAGEPVLGPAELAQLSRGTILLNTARGSCVDLPALLEIKGLGGLGLDVFPSEPYPSLEALAARPDVLLTPHAAGYFPGLGEALAQEVSACAGAWVQEQPLPHRV